MIDAVYHQIEGLDRISDYVFDTAERYRVAALISDLTQQFLILMH